MPYPTKKLGEICEIQNGYAFKSKDYIDFSNTLNFRMSNIRPGGELNLEHNKKYLPDNYIEKYSNFLLKNGDIVIAMTDMATSPKILAIPTIIKTDNRKLLLNQRVGKFKNINFDRIIISYLKYILLTPQSREKLVSMGGGGVQINISTKQILSLEIPLPPLPTQKLIVQKLDSVFKNIDESIKITKKNIENIEELNKSVLEKVFQGYNYETISNLVIKGKNWNPKSIGNEIFEYIDISSIDNKNYILTKTKKIKGNEAPSRAKQLVNKNDIIFATTRPNLKNIAIIDIDIKNLTSSTGFCVLRSIKNKLYYKFLYYYIITDTFFDKLSPLIRGTQYPAISDKDLKGLKIPLPPLPKQKEIVAYLDKVFEKNKALKESYEKKMKDLEEMKQSVLREAFENEEFVKEK